MGELKGRLSRFDAAIDISRGRQLFVDDYLIDFTGMRRTWHAAQVDERSPVLRPETAQELNRGVMPAVTLFSDGVWFDAAAGNYKMWYMAGYDGVSALATSTDGIVWERPSFDVVPGTNIVLPAIPGFCRNGTTVWLDERGDPTERFKMFVYHRRTDGSWPRRDPAPLPPQKQMGRIYTSPDGVHWTDRGETGPVGDVSKFFHSPFIDKWVFCVRSKTEGLGRSRAYHADADFVAASRFTEADLQFLAACDGADVPDPRFLLRPELYEMDCTPYESLMIGLFGIYVGPPNEVSYSEGVPKTIDLMLGSSRDGLTWERPNRTPFIQSSREEGSWYRGYPHCAGGLALVGRERLTFYFCGFSGVSPAQGMGPYAGGSIGFATLRRDGFASMDAPGVPMPIGSIIPTVPAPETVLDTAHGASLLVTRPVLFSGAHMFINADIPSHGAMRVAVLDATGDPLPGYGFDDCAPLSGDSTKARVRWAGSEQLEGLAGRPLRFAFQLDAGSLYSFWISGRPTGESGGYLAAGSHEYRGLVDE